MWVAVLVNERISVCCEVSIYEDRIQAALGTEVKPIAKGMLSARQVIVVVSMS